MKTDFCSVVSWKQMLLLFSFPVALCEHHELNSTGLISDKGLLDAEQIEPTLITDVTAPQQYSIF